jgi:hypothetical protein
MDAAPAGVIPAAIRCIPDRTLPTLFFPLERYQSARAQFWELLTDIFCDSFISPIDTLCRAHDKRLAALLKSEEHPRFQVPTHGSAQQIFSPAVDTAPASQHPVHTIIGRRFRARWQFRRAVSQQRRGSLMLQVRADCLHNPSLPVCSGPTAKGHQAGEGKKRRAHWLGNNRGERGRWNGEELTASGGLRRIAGIGCSRQ